MSRKLVSPVVSCSANPRRERLRYTDSQGEKETRRFLCVLRSRAAAFVVGSSLLVQPAAALDVNSGSIWRCLLNECRAELARCLRDPTCAANAFCLETCSESDGNCHVRCGDMFQSEAVDDFNSCVVSRKRCVAQKPDDGQFPVPPDCALVNDLKTEDLAGTWYIVSGLNPAFDLFDCQVTEFSAIPSKLTGRLTWRVDMPDGGFITRERIQNFVQSPDHPGVLSNRDNEYLHYQDDWFIVSARLNKQPDDYVFVYYKGSNDAWEGFGGAVVYARSPELPDGIGPELRQAAARVGLDYNRFHTTDNSCKPQLSFLAKIQKKLFQGEKAFAKQP